MPTSTQAPDTVPDPRWEMMLHLEAIARKRTEHQEIVGQRDKLRALIRTETDAQAKLDAIKQRDAAELADQLLNPTGLHILVDHSEQSDAEWELMQARREADAARACEPAVLERMAASSREAASLEQRTVHLVADVLFDEAQALRAEIDADAKRLRTKYARLWGLRRHVGETPAILKRLEVFPAPTHPDHITPDLGELIAEAERWRGYSARLAANPEAKFKE